MAGIDSRNVLDSVTALPEQLLHAYEEAMKVEVPDAYREADALLCCGMGGSGLGARFLETVYADRIQVPFVRIQGYTLPAFVDERSLVLCASYSGTTEEVLADWEEGAKRGALRMAIAAGGALLDEAKRAGAPCYQVVPTHNPSDQPRMAVGYMVTGTLVLAAKAGLIALTKEEIEDAAAEMRRAQGREKEAKALAGEAKGKALLFAAAEHLVGPLHTVNNQCNENAKALTFDFSFPELNHHLLEGLQHPPSNKEHAMLILVDSPSYDARNRKRLRITAEVAEKNGIPVAIHEVEKGPGLAEGFSLIQFGAYLAYHLAMAYGQDPAAIPFVDYFKERMKEPDGKMGTGERRERREQGKR